MRRQAVDAVVLAELGLRVDADERERCRQRWLWRFRKAKVPDGSSMLHYVHAAKAWLLDDSLQRFMLCLQRGSSLLSLATSVLVPPLY